MEQVYTRKSLTNSIANTDKTFSENIVKENNVNKLNETLKKLMKNWDKLVYTFSILVVYFNYVSFFKKVIICNYQL